MTDPQQIQAQKAALRSQMRHQVRQLDPAVQREQSQLACRILNEQSVWRNARSVLFYAPINGEVDLWPLVPEALDSGKTVCLPWFDVSTHAYQARRIRDIAIDIQIGHHGIREPVASCDSFALKGLDFILVPGVAFDNGGRRLGRGKGYYDRILSQVKGIKCGVGWDVQVCSRIPVMPHDVTLDCILTPTRWFFAGYASV